MQSLPRWLQMAFLALALALIASACGGDADESDVTAPSTLAPTTTAATLLESGPGGEYGCRGSGVRAFTKPGYEPPPSLTFDEALNAPELDPGRMALIYEAVAAGDDISVLNPSVAELALADDYLEIDQLRADIVELADAAAGNGLAGTWIQDNVLMIATAGDPGVVESALANVAVPYEVVQVDYRARQLNRWARKISELGTPADPVLVNVDEIHNVITVQISPEAPFDLSDIPCAAVELILAGDL